MYKTLGFRWLFEIFCHETDFVTADRDEARNPLLAILSNIWFHAKQTVYTNINLKKRLTNEKKF